MASTHNTDIARLIELWANASHFARKACFCKHKVNFAQERKALINFIRIGGYQGRKLRKDALDLLCFFSKQFLVFVSKLHNSRRLNKKRRAASALVVDKAWHLLAIFLLNRDYKASVSDGNDGLLQILLVGGRPYHCIEALPHALIGHAHSTADTGKCGRCTVKNLLFADDAAENLFFHAAVRGEKTRHVKKEAVLILFGQKLLRNTHGTQAFCNAKKFPSRKIERGMDTL